MSAILESKSSRKGANRSADTIGVRNPSSGELLGELEEVSDENVLRAINEAADAFVIWSATSADERARILHRWADQLRQNEDRLARLLSSEQGKPIREARAEIAASANFADYFAAAARGLCGEEVASPLDDRRLLVQFKPVGVCAAITPWNFPASMVARKLAPALAAGCSVVLKPSELTPLIAIEMASLAIEAGVPAGALRIVIGDGARIGKMLCESKTVRKISFTGSTRVGIALFAASAPTMKRLSLELGGNAPFVVLDDADLDDAVQGAVQAKFRNGGQSCVAANRFIVHSSLFDDFVRRFSLATDRLKVGPSHTDDNDIGPMISTEVGTRLRALVSTLITEGAQLENQYVELDGPYVSPAVLTGVPTSSLAFSQEIFGPIAIVYRADSNEEALRLANEGDCGLASYVFTQNLGRAMRIDRHLDTGMIAVNTGFMSHEAAPFGGTKMSGIGREGSRHGLNEYLEIRYTCYGGMV